MAEFKTMSGILGASAVAGSVLVATTDVDAAAVTTAGFIPWSAGADLHKGDAIIVNYMETSGDPATIRSDWFVVGSNSSDTITLQIMSGYGGSGLGNDTAGFSRKFLSGNIGAGSESFNLFTYNNAIDDMATVLAANYFNDAADILRVDDVIYATTKSGGRGADLLKVTAVSATGVVTVAATDFKQH